MKQLIILLLIAITFTSCITQQKCLERFPPKTDSLVTHHDTTIVRDTVITQPGVRIDTAYILQADTPCKGLAPFTKTFVKDGITVVISGSGYDINLTAVKGAVSTPVERISSVTTSNTDQTKVKTVPTFIDKPYTPKFFWIALIVAIVETLGIGFYTYLKIKK